MICHIIMTNKLEHILLIY